MNVPTMMGCGFYPAVGSETTETPMQIDADHEEFNEGRQSATPAVTTVAVPSITRGYAPVEMERALRVMSHAGRILWRAAMEAIPGGVGSYNPSIEVLSKLWKLSFGKAEKKDKTKSLLPTLPFGKTKACTGEKNDIITAFDEEHDDAMQTVPDCTNDCYDAREVHVEVGVEFPPIEKKRKKFFSISSLLPSVVSDSEEEDDNRPSKRFRRTFEDEPATRYW